MGVSVEKGKGRGTKNEEEEWTKGKIRGKTQLGGKRLV